MSSIYSLLVNHTQPAGHGKILHNVQRHGWQACTSPNAHFLMTNKSRHMRWSGHVECTGLKYVDKV